MTELVHLGLVAIFSSNEVHTALFLDLPPPFPLSPGQQAPDPTHGLLEESWRARNVDPGGGLGWVRAESQQ